MKKLPRWHLIEADLGHEGGAAKLPPDVMGDEAIEQLAGFLSQGGRQW